MRASIIIPAFNAEKTLSACLTACQAQSFPDFEIIVVDDGSTDCTTAVATRFSGVRLLQQANQGPAAARNHGARAASGVLLVCTDADCIPDPGWLGCLAACFNDGVAAAGGTYTCANPRKRLARVIQAEIAQRHTRFGVDVDFLGSFNVAFRAAAFKAAGGFDETYRYASGEDNDLSYRLQDAGGRLVFTRDAVVAHYHPDHLLPYLRTQARHGYWRMKLYRDHPARVTGDHYAGWPDLMAPPLALALLFVLPSLLAAGLATAQVRAAIALCGVLFLVYAGLHFPKVWGLRNGLALGDLIYFWAVACLRDAARAAGLAKGFWFFVAARRRFV